VTSPFRDLAVGPGELCLDWWLLVGGEHCEEDGAGLLGGGAGDGHSYAVWAMCKL
jgi:hypothetical protein